PAAPLHVGGARRGKSTRLLSAAPAAHRDPTPDSGSARPWAPPADHRARPPIGWPGRTHPPAGLGFYRSGGAAGSPASLIVPLSNGNARAAAQHSKRNPPLLNDVMPAKVTNGTRGRIALMQWATSRAPARRATSERGTYQWQLRLAGPSGVRVFRHSRQVLADSEAANELAVLSIQLLRQFNKRLLAICTPSISTPTAFWWRTSRGGRPAVAVLSQSIVGGDRLHYRPWHRAAVAALFDFDSAETLASLAYPSRQRLLANSFLAGELPRRLALSVHGLTRTEFSYHPDTKLPSTGRGGLQLQRRAASRARVLSLLTRLASTAESGLAPVHHRYTLDARATISVHQKPLLAAARRQHRRSNRFVNTTWIRGHVTGQLDIRLPIRGVSRMKHTITLQDGRAMRRFHFDSNGPAGEENTLHFASGPGSGFDARAFVLSLHSCQPGTAREAGLRAWQMRLRVSLEYAKDRLGRPVQRPRPADVGWLASGFGFDAEGFLSWRRNRQAARAYGALPVQRQRPAVLRADCVADGGTHVYSLHYLYDSRDRSGRPSGPAGPEPRLPADVRRSGQPPWRVSHAFLPAMATGWQTLSIERIAPRQLVATMEKLTASGPTLCATIWARRWLALLDSRGIALNQLSYSHTGLAHRLQADRGSCPSATAAA
uniref:TonB_dep_Rec domain-containing protein n=1 Tax=Macrostomum lignano TaxID=282301 RepID=A0A1I8FBU6_9PLAT